ncbi:hypothetical protein NX868_25840 [Burkholderia thailandensis]|uniref:hypothetical protein n=1 Tax=Burkholderia thailandensis TaxID=57975 RepID=UPI000309BA3B|nr:hypothetical protein [Burkholderia thailandensis]AHI68249.1 hypothetical protein BTL_5238 [Burkholderia thailandensis H0587]AOJ52791.1 hypothetical protein AQ475_17780 [Burkholderia thailandensis]AVR29107.1 hypothetical protein A8H32_30615 [Burkholderia thailandensis]MCS3394702.1 hypothetical protein [Burkholderia thailandensis]MCS6428685.1 hypothetical protein [Burkholderia thailandensis]
MNIRNADTFTFDKLASRHESSTQALERAIASNCTTLRTRIREYREIVAFRRQPHSRKLARALWIAAWRMPRVDDDWVAALSSRGNLATIAGVLGEWLGTHAMPVGRVAAIDPPGDGAEIPEPRAVYCMRCVVEFGQKVVDARAPIDLDLAASHLVDAALSIGANLLIDVLLRRARVRIRHPSSVGGDGA